MRKILIILRDNVSVEFTADADLDMNLILDLRDFRRNATLTFKFEGANYSFNSDNILYTRVS